MESIVRKSLMSGIVATLVMTLFMMMAPFMGMPEMNPPAMLSAMMSMQEMIGWVMHFMIGIMFAASYLIVFKKWLVKISQLWLRGVAFGLIIFVLAQVMMGIIGMMLPMPEMEGNMILMMVGSILGHVVFGITVIFLTAKG